MISISRHLKVSFSQVPPVAASALILAPSVSEARSGREHGLSRIRHAGHRTCRIPSHDLPGLESSRKTLVLRPLVLIGSTNVSTLSIGRPKLYPTFSGDVLWVGLCIQLSCWRFFTQHSAWKSGTLRQGPFTIVEQALSFRQALGSFFSRGMNTLSESRYCGEQRRQAPEKRSPHFDFLTNKANVRSAIEPAQLSYSIVTKRKICSHICLKV